jgi:predicted RNA-binding Zn-ribbon protein involved in translation (DUF1610 family)
LEFTGNFFVLKINCEVDKSATFGPKTEILVKITLEKKKKKKLFFFSLQKVSQNKQGVCHTCGLAIYIKKGLLRQKKKNCGNSNISPCKNIIFQKSSKTNQNPSRYYYNSIIINTSPKYHLLKILT